MTDQIDARTVNRILALHGGEHRVEIMCVLQIAGLATTAVRTVIPYVGIALEVRGLAAVDRRSLQSDQNKSLFIRLHNPARALGTGKGAARPMEEKHERQRLGGRRRRDHAVDALSAVDSNRLRGSGLSRARKRAETNE